MGRIDFDDLAVQDIGDNLFGNCHFLAPKSFNGFSVGDLPHAGELSV